MFSHIISTASRTSLCQDEKPRCLYHQAKEFIEEYDNITGEFLLGGAGPRGYGDGGFGQGSSGSTRVGGGGNGFNQNWLDETYQPAPVALSESASGNGSVEVMFLDN